MGAESNGLTHNGDEVKLDGTEALDAIEQFYYEKPREDYLRILTMVENEEDLSREKIMSIMQLPEEVVVAFFDHIVQECENDPARQNRICDRLVKIQWDRLPEIAKHLKIESFKLKAEIKELKAVHNKVVSELEALKGVQELENEREELRGKITELENRIEELLQELLELKENKPSDENQNQEQAEELTTLRGELFECKRKLEDVESANRQLQKAIEDNTDQGSGNNEGLIKELNEQIEALEEGKKTLQGKVFELAEQVEELEKSLAAQDGSANDERVNELLEERDEHFRKISSLSDEVAELAAALEEAKEARINNNPSEETTKQEEIPSVFDQAQIDTRPAAVKKGKMSTTKVLLIVMTVLTVLALLFFLVLKMLTPSDSNPVSGQPTPVAPVASAVPVAPAPNNFQAPETIQPIGGGDAVQQASLPTGPEDVQPVNATSVISQLKSPDDFRRFTSSMRVNDIGEFVIENQTFKPGQMINGFKLLMVQKGFVRLQEVSSGLSFRVDLGVQQ